MQAVLECAGSKNRLFWSVQAVPECPGSGCRLPRSLQDVGAGCSRVCRQWKQAVREFRLLQSV